MVACLNESAEMDAEEPDRGHIARTGDAFLDAKSSLVQQLASLDLISIEDSEVAAEFILTCGFGGEENALLLVKYLPFLDQVLIKLAF